MVRADPVPPADADVLAVPASVLVAVAVMASVPVAAVPAVNAQVAVADSVSVLVGAVVLVASAQGARVAQVVSVPVVLPVVPQVAASQAVPVAVVRAVREAGLAGVAREPRSRARASARNAKSSTTWRPRRSAACGFRAAMVASCACLVAPH